MNRLVALLAVLPSLLAAQAKPSEPVRLGVAPAGNEARYVVREQLVGVELPNDAIGATSAVSGAIVLDGRGAVDTAASRITIDLTTLKSNRDRRDGFIKRRTLVTDSFPNAVLQVTAIKGLPARLPTSGTLSLTVTGNLTVHGVTKATTWTVTAAATGTTWTGKAVTNVKFGDFGMTQPRVPVVLSVVDDIRLEWDFTLVREPSGP